MAGGDREPGSEPAPLTIDDIVRLGIMNGHMMNDEMSDDLNHDERSAVADRVRIRLGLTAEQFRHDNTPPEDDDTV